MRLVNLEVVLMLGINDSGIVDAYFWESLPIRKGGEVGPFPLVVVPSPLSFSVVYLAH